MSEKKKQIMEVAMRCFSRQGFEATSIQEIAMELGMAKGSIYFYFKSKEDLLLSVIAYYGERMLAGMTTLPEERQLPPRERLLLQLRRHYAYVLENREFPIMLMREPAVFENRKTKMQALMIGMERSLQQWMCGHIDEIYGREAYEYSADGAMLFAGMMKEYLRLLFIGKPAIDVNRLAEFQVNRLDDIMLGMIRSKSSPIVPRGSEDERGRPGKGRDHAGEVRQAARRLRRAMQQEELPADQEERRSDLLAALSRFEEELAKPAPDRILARGMLAYLKEEAPPAWRADVDALERIWGAKP
ncbi:TetR/AcrR family transcriptional regulator [Cohnella lubricantis]|uniref:TetR/AcrR family transcriptional regulator n=1 Tax=Cohnella lubricantis TaxID=2163172 RepID=A0A841TBG9_9BACL|nr:TetR/AcrR family transcriptional regulator [Cohnella lubricantis]MBB6678644.1 TetR/AcrR family transcriptional regulator [Cohnella lubricantis]MBP2119196.1 AcrR family transcriptional regulator [Cohnella lubricantis]